MFVKREPGKPRWHETLLFIALLSGPPAFRERDPSASLLGDADWSVLLNAAIWGLGAFWVFLNLGGYLLKVKALPRFGSTHLLAFFLVFLLYVSTFTSLAPALTLYRVTQIPIAVLFGFFWIRRFGIESTLKHLLAGYLTLAVMIGAAAFVAPDLVYTDDTVVRDPRLRGDSIANAGAVGAMGLVLLLSYPVIKSRVFLVGMLGLLIALLALAQTRAAFAVVLMFLLLALFRLPRSVPLRSFLYFLGLLVPVGVALQLAPKLTQFVVREESSVSTLSDRLPLWQYTVSEVLERSPWTGLGFYANRTITSAYNAGLGTSHSAFIEVFSGGGIFASVAFGALLAAELFLAIKLLLLYGKTPVVFTTVTLFFGTLLVGLTSEEMVIASPTSFVFWTMVSLILMVDRVVYFRVQREEIGTTRNSPSGSRVLPAARR